MKTGQTFNKNFNAAQGDPVNAVPMPKTGAPFLHKMEIPLVLTHGITINLADWTGHERDWNDCLTGSPYYELRMNDGTILTFIGPNAHSAKAAIASLTH